MKAVFCFALILAVVAAEDVDVGVTPENILKDTSILSSSTPSSLAFGTAGPVQRDFSFGSNGASLGSRSSWSGFGSQAPIVGSSFSGSSSLSGVPATFLRGESGFSKSSSFGSDGIQKDSLVGQGGVSTSYDGPAASGAAALASGASKGSIDGFLKSRNGFGLNSAFPYYGYNGINNLALSGVYGSNWGNGGYYAGYNPLITSYYGGLGKLYGSAFTGLQSHGHSNVDTHVHVDTTQQKHINLLHTITKQVAVPQPYPVPVQVTKTVPVPQPYPVHIPKAVPVPYNVNVPVPVDKPIPVRVPTPVAVPYHVNVPVPVEKPYPVQVERVVQVPVEKPVYVRVPHPVAVKVPQPYPVHVPKAVPVQVASPVVVKVPEIFKIHKVNFATLPSQVVHYDGLYGNQGLYGGHALYGAQYGTGVVNGGWAYDNAIQSVDGLSHFGADQLNVADVSSAHIGSLSDGAYEIQAANLVGAHHYPAALGSTLYPEVVDAKFAYKRETPKKDEKKEDKKEGKKDLA